MQPTDHTLSQPHDPTGPLASPAAAVEPGDPVAREIQFLAELARLAADRAAVESQIDSQHRAATSAADRSAHETRQAFVAELEIERHDVAGDYAEQCRHAVSRYEHETRAVEQAFADLQRQVAQEFDSARNQAERKLQEGRWEAETLFEASKDVAPRQLKQFEEVVEAWLDRADGECRQSQSLLAAWGQSWRQDPLAAEPSTIAPGDALARLQERVELVVAQRLRLAALRVPPTVASLALVWLFGFAGLLLSGLALALGWGPIGAVAALLVASAAGVGVWLYLRSLAQAHIEQIYPALWQAALEAEALGQRCLDEARAAVQQTEVVARRQRALDAADEEYRARLEAIDQRRDQRLQGPAVEHPKRLEEISLRRARDLDLAESVRGQRDAVLQQKETALADIETRHRRQSQEIQHRYAAQWQGLVDRWRSDMSRVQAMADDIWRDHGQGTTVGRPGDCSPWASGAFEPASVVPRAVRVGAFHVAMREIEQGVPRHKDLAELTPTEFWLPALVRFPRHASLLFKAQGAGRRVAVQAMQAFMLRLLVTIPPGKLRFTIIDPVGLGENFAAFMHLADYNEALVSSRIWTEPRHIEQRLADLSEHMENVIQKYLRNEFESIEQYNRQAGEIAEPFRFLVVADFPANFSEAAQRRLLSIAHSGARCGVYTLIMADAQLRPAAGISPADLEQQATTLDWSQGRFVWQHERLRGLELKLDAPPPPARVTELLHFAGEYANQAGRVEVPFEVIAPPPGEFWATSARSGIEVPLGRSGATRLQSLKLGTGTSQHVLVAGKTGSGKSTLLHALVTNLALRYSPDEIELYLVDFKQGVEFKTYAAHHLPHARVVAIESDREFGVSVLARLDAELKARADRFRALAVQDLAGFREAEPGTPMPRILVIVDEFQEFFVEDDKIAQDAGLLLDRLVRQGRAFGIHVLLGSQTLAGTYTLARSTIGQMAVRIALQCSETDAHLILSEDNSAARLLSRAGEAIYNDSNGLVEGNHPFQIVWLGDERREKYLEQVRALAAAQAAPPRPQVVFEGNVAADPERNEMLSAALQNGRPAAGPAAPRAWLGEAVAIKDPTSVTFRRQSGSNLLIVGQNEEAALGILTSTLVSLSAQHPATPSAGVRFYIFDGSPAGSSQAASLGLVGSLTPDAARLVAWRELPATVGELAGEVERRQKAVDTQFPPIFVLVYGLQKLRDLRRQEDDFGFSRPGENRPPDCSKQFVSVLRDGPTLGIFSLVWCDSVNNLNRTWERSTLREFEMRVAFQMSASDSSTLVDTPVASKLGAHRALLHSEEQAVLEKFRPYRWPSPAWLDWVRRQLHASPEERDSRSQRLTV